MLTIKDETEEIRHWEFAISHLPPISKEEQEQMIRLIREREVSVATEQGKRLEATEQHRLFDELGYEFKILGK